MNSTKSHYDYIINFNFEDSSLVVSAKENYNDKKRHKKNCSNN